jgi:hypothetical protein
MKNPSSLLVCLVCTVALAACAPLTKEGNKVTSTTLAERCAAYQAGEVAADALATAFPELAGAAALDDAAVTALCHSVSHR